MLPTKTKEWHDERRQFCGGSDANIIVNGTDEDRHSLWEVKTGLKPPPDLSDVFQVALGTLTEDFNLSWFEKKTGMKVIRRGERVIHGNKWMSATLDGATESGAVVEAKHTSERYSTKDLVARYQPQLHHNMMCAGVTKSYLTVIRGNTYDYAEIDLNAEYAAELVRILFDFWECVKLKMPPGPGGKSPEAPAPHRLVDMSGSNEWADAAADWKRLKEPAANWDIAVSRIRGLVEPDVKEARGFGIVAKRDKRGAIRISEVK